MAGDNLVREILDEALRMAGGADVKKRTRAMEALNRAQRSWASKRPWEGLKRTEDFTHTGGRTMGLPSRVKSITDILDITNGRKVEPSKHWSSQNPSTYAADTPGAAVYYRKGPILPIISQPSVVDELTFDSSGSEAYTVRVEGLRQDTAASGTQLEYYEDRVSFVMGGTGGSTYGAGSWYKVFSLEKDEDTLFDLKVSEATSGTVLARIPNWASATAYPTIEFLYIPTAGTVFRIDYFTKPQQITSEESVLDPSIDREYLVWRICGDVQWGQGDRDSAQVAWAKADVALNERAVEEQIHGENDFRAIPQWTYMDRENYDG